MFRKIVFINEIIIIYLNNIYDTRSELIFYHLLSTDGKKMGKGK